MYVYLLRLFCITVTIFQAFEIISQFLWLCGVNEIAPSLPFVINRKNTCPQLQFLKLYIISCTCNTVKYMAYTTHCMHISKRAPCSSHVGWWSHRIKSEDGTFRHAAHPCRLPHLLGWKTEFSLFKHDSKNLEWSLHDNLDFGTVPILWLNITQDWSIYSW